MGDYLQPPYDPVPVDQVTLAFPADVVPLMPDPTTIPDEFRSNEWESLANSWFSLGMGNNAKFWLKDGIDGDTAVRHLRAILGSFQPKHEHKLAAVAFLMSQWFDKVDLDNAKKK